MKNCSLFYYTYSFSQGKKILSTLIGEISENVNKKVFIEETASNKHRSLRYFWQIFRYYYFFSFFFEDKKRSIKAFFFNLNKIFRNFLISRILKFYNELWSHNFSADFTSNYTNWRKTIYFGKFMYF